MPSNHADGALGAGRPSGRPPGTRVRGHQITERDLEILRWIARHGVVTAELVGRRFFWRPDRNTYGKWAADRRIAALQRMRLVIRASSYGYPLPVLRITRQGAQIADVGIGPAPLVASQLRHSLALVWLTEYLLIEHAGAQLVTERELRAQRYRDLRNGNRETEHGRAPDALLYLPARDSATSAQTVAIELDLSRKDRRAMERMVRQYDREHVDRVWWFVRPVQVARTRQLVHQLHADDRIEVRQWLV